MLSKYFEKQFSTDDVYTVLDKEIETYRENKKRYIQLHGENGIHENVIRQFDAMIIALLSLYHYF